MIENKLHQNTELVAQEDLQETDSSEQTCIKRHSEECHSTSLCCSHVTQFFHLSICLFCEGNFQ